MFRPVAITVLLLAALTPLAIAHEGGVAAAGFFISEAGVYEESNGIAHHGVNWHSGYPDGDTGIQRDQVCFGTFTDAQIVKWNYDMSGGHFGADDGSSAFIENDVNYIPFTADAAAFFAAYASLAAFDAAECSALGGTLVQPDRTVASLP
ncbi:MAG: hypothetical protein WDA16_09380 [Candidatus Thermoplasmatota archaeon]